VGTAAATLLRLMEHHREVITDASNDALGSLCGLRWLFHRSLAIEFVPVGAGGYHEDIHVPTIAEFKSLSGDR